MVRENILEFERKHSKNLTELNEWVEKIKTKEDKTPKHAKVSLEKKEPDPWGNPVLLEDSKLYKETGKLWDCDPLYKKINLASFEDISHLKVLSAYLTEAELKERLTYENYMLIETEKIIDEYLAHVEDKKVRDRIYRLKRELKDLEKSLQKPTVDDKVEEILANMNKRTGI